HDYWFHHWRGGGPQSIGRSLERCEQHRSCMDCDTTRRGVGGGFVLRTLRTDPLTSKKTARAPSKERQLKSTASGPTILIVEPDQRLRSTTAQFLEHHGCTVLEAGNGEEAEALLS